MSKLLIQVMSIFDDSITVTKAVFCWIYAEFFMGGGGGDDDDKKCESATD